MSLEADNVPADVQPADTEIVEEITDPQSKTPELPNIEAKNEPEPEPAVEITLEEPILSQPETKDIQPEIDEEPLDAKTDDPKPTPKRRKKFTVTEKHRNAAMKNLQKAAARRKQLREEREQMLLAMVGEPSSDSETGSEEEYVYSRKSRGKGAKSAIITEKLTREQRLIKKHNEEMAELKEMMMGFVAAQTKPKLPKQVEKKMSLAERRRQVLDNAIMG